LITADTMSTDYDNALLKEGVLHYKVGETSLARRYFERALETADDNLTRLAALEYLSRLVDDPVLKRHYLESALAIDLVHPEARRALAILDGRLSPEEIINPDHLPPPAPGNVTVQMDRFTCPKCGGRMVYSPDGSSLTCEFCARTQPLEAEPAAEQDFFAAMASARGHNTAVFMQVSSCQGCGAEFLLPARELSAACAWCGSVHVLRQDRTLAAPDSILPFTLDQAEAWHRLQAWAKKGQPWAGGEIPAPRLLYLPVWCFTIVGSTPWSGQTYRNRQFIPVAGEEMVYLVDMSVPAVKGPSHLFTPLLAGVKFSLAVAYDSRYLAGWSAQVPSVSLANAALEARRLAVAWVRQAVDLQNDGIRNLRIETSRLSVDTYRLVLLPVWLLDIPGRGSSLPVAVNGITGTVHSG
jgi:predicted RNA-binding Zn-ribbon protein involved in translation (DUF1610 family)